MIDAIVKNSHRYAALYHRNHYVAFWLLAAMPAATAIVILDCEELICMIICLILFFPVTSLSVLFPTSTGYSLNLRTIFH